MICPICHNKETKVIDKRDSEEQNVTRRRRECLKCKFRFTTYEKIEKLAIKVRKRDGALQDYDREKMINGLILCAEKRLPKEEIEKLVDDIEACILPRKTNEVASVELGRMVLDRLKLADKISYLRFASVFLDFADVNELKKEIEKLE